MLENLHISIPSRHTATPPFPSSPSLRASSYKSSDGSIAPLRRSSSISSLIPETDASLDNSLKGEAFQLAIVKILIKLKLTSWKLSESENLVIKNIASALTNSVYLIILDTQKLLLRIYGPNVLHLIDRDYETSVLSRLAHHRIGPRLLGQFKNGRVEQWLESVEVTSDEIRDRTVSRYIARRMREFHDFVTLLPPEMDKVSATVNLDSWIPALPKERVSPSIKTFLKHVQLYRDHVKTREGEVVFCHNDLQYGNLLRINGEEHQCLAVIDFEYAGPNPRAFDLANHFIEWMANYHEAPSHELNPAFYPSVQEAENFLEEYIRFGKVIARKQDPIVSPEEVKSLRNSVDLWRAMSHAQWAIWGIIQALPAAASTALEERIIHNEAAEELSKKPRRNSSALRRGSSRPSESPMVHAMRSPFLSPATSQFGTKQRTNSAKSPGYFPTTLEPAPESNDSEDEFSLGEPAIAALGREHIHEHHHPAPNQQAEDVWIDDEESGFDYIAYSHERMGLFYGELIRMELVTEEDVPEGIAIKRLPPSALTG